MILISLRKCDSQILSAMTQVLPSVIWLFLVHNKYPPVLSTRRDKSIWCKVFLRTKKNNYFWTMRMCASSYILEKCEITIPQNMVARLKLFFFVLFLQLCPVVAFFNISLSIYELRHFSENMCCHRTFEAAFCLETLKLIQYTVLSTKYCCYPSRSLSVVSVNPKISNYFWIKKKKQMTE